MKLAFIVAIVFLTLPISVRASTWKDGQGCAYSPILIGQNAATSNGPDAFVDNIREIVDGRGRTVGYLYVTDKGYAVQGNALMTNARRRHFHLATMRGPFTSIEPTSLAAVGKSAIGCRPEHKMRSGAPTYRIAQDQAHAYASGRDYLPDPIIDLSPSH